jgi:4-amino-4-deoxy-L-arabinose transferase-like glycosyltransferase
MRIKFQTCAGYFAAFFLIIPSVIWNLFDKSVWPWDQSWYAEISTDLNYLLKNDIDQWWGLMTDAFGIKAPAIAWLGQFFLFFANNPNSIEFSLLLSVSVIQFLSLVLIYNINYRINKSISFNSILLVGSAPLFIAMGHQYLVESFQLFFVTLIMWITIASPEEEKNKTFILLGIAMILGMAIKITSPLYVVFYTFGILYNQFAIKKIRGENKSKNLIWIFLFLLITSITFSWYFKNFNKILTFAKEMSLSQKALNYGNVDTFTNKFIYWLNALLNNFFIPKIFFILCLVIIFTSCVKKNKWEYGRNETIFLILTTLNILLVITVFSLSINQENRYLLPVLPMLAIALMFIEKKLSRSLKIFITILFLIQFAIINSISFNLPTPIKSLCYWLKPLNKNSEIKDTLNKLVFEIGKNSVDQSINVVGVDIQWLNANTLSYFSSKVRPKNNKKIFFTSLGYAESDTKQSIKRIEEIKPNFFITLTNKDLLKNDDFLNRTSKAASEYVSNNVNYKKYNFDNTDNIVIYKKNNMGLIIN